MLKSNKMRHTQFAIRQQAVEIGYRAATFVAAAAVADLADLAVAFVVVTLRIAGWRNNGKRMFTCVHNVYCMYGL